VRESLVTSIWINQLFKKEGLRTVDGGRIKVRHPGRQSTDCGPDVTDAVIVFDGGRPVHGDIEIHVGSSEWMGHGHHLDPNFNRVILHVVLWHRGGTTFSPTKDGREVPILPLAQYLTKPLEQLAGEAQSHSTRQKRCYAAARKRGRPATLAILQAAGERRFAFKARQLQRALALRRSDQVLYEGIMRALGYTKNEMAFTRLATLLPIERLHQLAASGQMATIQALSLGVAGLLPSEGNFSPEDVAEIDRLRAPWKGSGMKEVMKRGDWRFFRVRTANLPPRRLAGVSHLLVRHCGDLSQNIVRLAGLPSLREARKTLAEALIVRTSDYWASHGDFGVGVPLQGAVIGPDRATDIRVNVILPFVMAHGHIHRKPWLSNRARKLYRTERKLSENRITRYMARQIFGEGSRGVDSACQQQGLIHLYGRYCVRAKCAVCPLS